MDKQKLPPNELDFLYKRCKKIKPVVISLIGLCPEYMEVLKGYSGKFDDNVVFELLSVRFRQLKADGLDRRNNRKVIRAISRAVKGNPDAWKQG